MGETPDHPDDHFVSISLEHGPCKLCGQETGEVLVSTCRICHRNNTERTQVRTGFNELPGLLHTDKVVAHDRCLVRSHQLLLLEPQIQRSSSPLAYRRGISVPNDFNMSCFGSHEKSNWIANITRNEGLRNTQNRLQVHSNPCTRSNSPVMFIRETLDKDEGVVKGRSDSNLSDTHFLELKKSYARYLHGSAEKLTSSKSDDNVGHRAAFVKGRDVQQRHSSPNVSSPLSNRNVNLSPATKDQKESVDTCRVRRVSKENREPKHENSDSETETRRGCNEQKSGKDQICRLNVTDLNKVISKFNAIIKGKSEELVDLLQERDSLDHEVKFRNLTIQKLVKLKHQQQQEFPVKSASISNI